ncbi:MAG TPA: MaoC family dehydratase, partial [bacterium]|nr:MaoC family dehydratase [bacterium]
MNTTFPGEVRLAQVTERESLARERDPELRADGLLSLAGREQAHGRSEAAAEIYAGLLQEPHLSESVRRRAQDRLGALRGNGPVGARVEVLFQRLTHEMTEPTTLLAMGVAGAAFKMTRFVALSRLAASPNATFLTRGGGARVLAGMAGFGVEAAVFPLAGRLGSAALGRDLDWSAQALSHDLLSSALTLGSLRSGGWLMGHAGRLAGGGALTRGALAQAGMLGGILASRRLEEGLGMRERLPGATLLTDGLVTLFQFNAAARLSRGLFGQRFQRWEQEVDMRSATLGTPTPRSPGLSPQWAVVSAATGGRRFNPFDLNVLMAQSHDPANPGADSGPRASERPIAASERPISAESNGGQAPGEPVVQARPLTPMIVLGQEAVRQQGEAWEMDFRIGSAEAKAYRGALDLEVAADQAPSGMTFSKAFPAIVAASEAAMQRAPRPTVIHGVEEIQYREPLRFDEALRLRVTRKTRGAEGKPQQVFLTREIFRVEEGQSARPAVTAKSVLVVGPELSAARPTSLSPAEREALPEPMLVLEVTPQLIDAFCRGSGDFNPVHVSDAAAQELGLPGRILHGMA